MGSWFAAGAARRTLIAALGAAIPVAMATTVLPGSPAETRAAGGEDRPNIVLIVTDDQTKASFNRRVMPRTWRLLSSQGTRFKDVVTTTPACCPSRASILTGQYAHNHGVMANRLGYAAMQQKPAVLPAWLDEAGYKTAHVGKFLNGYFRDVSTPTTPAPGWHRWQTLRGYRYYNYQLTSGDRMTKFDERPADYLTRQLNEHAVSAIERFSAGDKPFYLQLDQFAPHATMADSADCPRGPLPDPRDESAFSNRALPRPPSFNEKDVSDKRSFLRNQDRLSPEEIKLARDRYRCRLASLRAVDRGTQMIWDALRRQNEAKNTVVIFTTDNGFFAGEHRIPASKTLPYSEALEVPFAIRAPNSLLPGRAVGSVGELAANIDLAPTILDLADAEPCLPAGCRRLDGRSLVPLLSGAPWPAARSVVIEYGVGDKRDRNAGACQFAGIRQPDRIFVRYNEFGECPALDEAELYRLDQDPFELDNLADDPDYADEKAELRTTLDSLRDCTGIEGRDPPPPSGRSYCE
jgi:arylsulfatase A-like enzyme